MLDYKTDMNRFIDIVLVDQHVSWFNFALFNLAVAVIGEIIGSVVVSTQVRRLAKTSPTQL